MTFLFWFVFVLLGLALNYAYVILCYLSAPRFIKKLDSFLDFIEKRREEREEW